MSKKKHKFVHADPERQTAKLENKSSAKKPTKTPDPNSYGYIKEDLKRSVIAISIFVLVLIAFYIINNQYDILGYINNISI